MIVALLGVSLIGGGQRSQTPPAPQSPTAFFPLAGTPGTIAYADGGAGGGALWLIGTDGSGKRKLGEDITGNLVQPDWSPSGDRLLVLDQIGDREQLWEVDPTGSRPSLVVIPCATPCVARDEASYSPDGDRIVFFEASGNVKDGIPTTCGMRVYTASRQAFDTVTASPCSLVEDREPRFSPDGQRIAFWRSRSPNGQRTTQIADAALFIRDLQTSKETQVTDWPVLASSLDWSPDGAWLVFATHWWDLRPATPRSGAFTPMATAWSSSPTLRPRSMAPIARATRSTADGFCTHWSTETRANSGRFRPKGADPSGCCQGSRTSITSTSEAPGRRAPSRSIQTGGSGRIAQA